MDAAHGRPTHGRPTTKTRGQVLTVIVDIHGRCPVIKPPIIYLGYEWIFTCPLVHVTRFSHTLL